MTQRSQAMRISSKSRLGKRQLHLSTAIGMMIFAGAFVGANLTEGIDVHTLGEPLNNSAERERLFKQFQRQEFAESYGLPFVACIRRIERGYLDGPVHTLWHFEIGGVIADAAVALSTLVIFGLLSEYLIRRWESTNS